MPRKSKIKQDFLGSKSVAASCGVLNPDLEIKIMRDYRDPIERYIARYRQIYETLSFQSQERLKDYLDEWKSKPLLERIVINLFQGVFLPFNEGHMRYHASKAIIKFRSS